MRFWLFLVVLLLSVGNASAINQFTNGGFETGDLTGWTTYSESPDPAESWTVDSAYSNNSDYGLSMFSPVGSSGYLSKMCIEQSVNLTNVDFINFDLKIPSMAGYPSACAFRVYMDGRSGTVIYSNASTTDWINVNINVSSDNGVHVIAFLNYVNGATSLSSMTSYLDNIIADGEPPKINIDTKITQNDEPLTSVGIDDESFTGGFPNEYGYRYLTPDEKESKEYTIRLFGDDLAPGFELLVFADSTDVTNLTIDIEDLDSTKTYDVFFDYEPMEQISGVSEIQYYITSFSWHSLELVPVQGVNLYGKVYNATSNATLASANVSLLQGSTHYNTTTDANGAYSVTNLLSNIPIHVNVTKTGYAHEDFNVTPEWTGNFQMDLYMLPVITGVHGCVVDYPWHQGINGSTVWLWNATYNTSTTSDVTGYYLITGIADGVYTMNASKDGYTTSDNVNVTVADNTFVQHFILSPTYNLTVTAVNSQTGTAIQSFTAVTETESINTANGSAVFSLGYGLYYVQVAATGYYPSFGYAFLDENEPLEVELTPTSIYYAPHYVKFTVKTPCGTLYSGVDVNVYLGDAATQYDCYKNGTTGTDGAVVFMMTETTRYTMTFIHTEHGINETRVLYPIDSRYYIYINESYTYDPGNVSTELTNYSTTNTSRGWAFHNLTSTDLNSTIGLGMLGQGIVASTAIWVIVGAGGPTTAFAAITAMAALGIVTWILALFCGMTAVSLYILGGKIR